MTNRKIFFGSLFLALLSIIFFWKVPHSNIDRTLAKISPQDRLVLSDLFQGLIENNCFGYTLFGNKPVSFKSYFIKTPLSILDFLQDRTSHRIHRGQKVWMKYIDTFKSKDFILKFEVQQDTGYVYLINKPAFLFCVTTHLDMFREVLGSHITPESLLDSIATSGISLGRLVANNSILEGLLLGYGKHNAILYQRSSQIREALQSLTIPPSKEKEILGNEHLGIEHRLYVHMNKQQKINPEECISKIVPGEGFATLAEEYEWLHAKFDIGDTLCPFTKLARFSFPGFCIDAESKESQKIITDYINTQKKMGEIYSSGNFLTITLKKFTGEL